MLIHAAGESSPGNLPDNTHAIALAARDETQLLDLERLLQFHNIRYAAIREDQGKYTGQLVAIGVTPQLKDTLRRYFSSLPLVK